MANDQFKGRKKGAVNSTMIKDPIMEPFFITKNQYGFVVNENKRVTNTKNDELSNKVVPVGYYSSFPMALKTIAKEKLNENKKTFDSLQEYVSEWRDITNKLETLINV